ncbi:MAG: glycosyl hydrolase family 18 protein [Blautia sp.]|jgi:spore germination protein YaaH
MKKKLIPVLVVLLLIFVVGVAGVVTHMIRKYTPTKEVMDPVEYYGEVGEEELPVMIDTEIIEQRGLSKGENAYLPLSVVNTYLNKRFYWDKEAQALLYSTTEETLEQAAEEDNSAMVLQYQDTVYVNMKYVAEHTDISYEYLQDPGRLVIQKTWSDFRAAEAKKETLVRYQGGIKSPVLTTMEAGTRMRLIEELEDWSQVATPDGFVGYVEKKDVEDLGIISEDRQFQEDAFEQLAMEETVNLTWHQVTSTAANATFDDAVAKVKGVNVISPTWFSIKDNDGTLSSIAEADYVNKAHAKGMKVWGLIDNFSEEIQTEKVLSSQSARTKIIDTLIKESVNCGMDGINVDFETMSEEAVPHFLQFLRELSIQTHKNNLVLSVDSPVPEGYTVFYDRAEQGRVVDYLIIMGYDEHYRGDTEAGSVASLPWVEQGIQDTLAEVPAEKVINGIPFYTRVWKTSTGVVTSDAVGMDDADNFVKKYKVETYWDKKTSQNYGSIDVGNDTYQVWLEDEDSIAEKVQLIPKYQLAGVASWKLGFERPGIWKVISEALKG